MFYKKNINNRIFTNTFFQFGSKFFSVLLAIITVSLLTRYLGTEGYGNFTLVFTFLSFFAVISDFGFNQIIVREFAHEKEKSDNVKATYFNIKLILNTLSIVLPLLVLPLFPYSVSLKIAIIIGIFAVTTGSIVSYGSAILQSRLRLDLVAFIDLLMKFITVLVIYFFTKIQASLFHMVGAVFIGNSIGLFVSYFFVYKDVKFKIFIDISLTKKLLKL